jgi:hypothetical protein
MSSLFNTFIVATYYNIIDESNDNSNADPNPENDFSFALDCDNSHIMDIYTGSIVASWS